MKKNNFNTTILLMFIWLIGLVAIVKGLETEPLISILGITAPYYLTKHLLVNEDEPEKEEI